MGKIRTARRRPGPALDPDDVLSGRAHPDARALADLIREVNPTGTSEAPERTQARYELKNRLQALLIRRFPAELSLLAEPGQPELYRLELRRGAMSACHLRLSDLAHDDEARAWALREVDLGPGHAADDPADDPDARVAVHREPAPGPWRGKVPARRDAGGDDDALSRGLRLAREYDYEAARACLGEALLASGGAPGPARALLGLLVGELGLDEEALALGPVLAAEAAADGEVRLQLGTAAARLGRCDEARALLAGLDRPAAAGAWLHLAIHAEAVGDLDRAEGDLEEARRADPAHPEAVAVGERVASRRAEAARPEEAAAQALLADGAVEEAAARARRILLRHPRSIAARRVLRASEERRHEARAAALLREAEAAAGSSAARALGLLTEALATGVGGALRGRIAALRDELSEAERRAERAARARHVAALLSGPDPRAGLVAYGALCEGDRAALRAVPTDATGGVSGRTAALLGWLDELFLCRADASPRAAAEAVLALEAAEPLVPEAPERALALLAPHGRHLQPIRAAARLFREARARIEEREAAAARAAAHERLAAAEARDDLADEERLALLADVDARLLSPEAEGRLAGLRTDLAARARAARLEGRLRAAEATLDLNAMRVALAAHGDGEPETVAAVERVERLARRRFALWSASGPGPAHELCDVSPCTLGADQAARQWLLPGGHELLLPEECDGVIFLRVIDVARMEVRRRALLPAPSAHGELNDVVLGSEGAWLHFSDGGTLLLDVDRLRVLLYYEGASLRPAAMRDTEYGPPACDQGRVLGRHFLWQNWYFLGAAAKIGREHGRAYVTDLRDPRRHTLVDRDRAHCPAAGLDQPVLCDAGKPGPPVSLRAIDGGPLGQARLPPDLHLLGAAAWPAGGALLLCSWRTVRMGLPPPEARDRGELVFAVLRQDGTIGEASPLPDSAADRVAALVPLREEGRALLRLDRLPHRDGETNHAQLCCLRAGGAGEPEVVVDYREEVQRGLFLVHDPALSRCLALATTADGLEARPAGARPPRFQRALPQAEDTVTDPSIVLLCALKLEQESHRLTEACREQVRVHRSPRDKLRAALGFARAEPARPARAWMAFEVICREDEGLLPGLIEALRGDGAEVRVWLAHGYAALRRWGDALSLVRDLAPKGVADRALRVHLHHLRALALLWTDATAAAEPDVSACLSARDHACQMLEPLRELTSRRPRWSSSFLGPKADPADARARAHARRLRELVAEADARLDAGDALGAWTLLDEPLVWRSHERQATARMCAAQLQLDWPDEVGRYRQLLCFARFAEAGGKRYALELPYPGHIWSRQRLEELASAARARLGAFCEATRGGA